MDVSIAGTTADTASDTEDVQPPPCRAAELYLVQCPQCGRRMRLKTLRYSHVCGRSFNILERANEQQIAAAAAIKVRMGTLKQGTTHCMQQSAASVPLASNKKDYSSLLALLR